MSAHEPVAGGEAALRRPSEMLAPPTRQAVMTPLPGSGCLFVLAFDHRSSLRRWLSESGLEADREKISHAKRLVVEGLSLASTELESTQHPAVLLDEEYGSGALTSAGAEGIARVVAVERSGMPEFDFEYGNAFMDHIEALQPVAVKALVRYNPSGDRLANERSRRRLRVLHDRLGPDGPALMLELLIPPTLGQLAQVGDQRSFDSELRPALTVTAMSELADGGVRPACWKVEGLENRTAAEMVGRVGSSTSVRGCLVLGRGADVPKVRYWLTVAAGVSGFSGFAVGRTIWQDAIAAWFAGRADAPTTAAAIAGRYLEMANAYTAGVSSLCP